MTDQNWTPSLEDRRRLVIADLQGQAGRRVQPTPAVIRAAVVRYALVKCTRDALCTRDARCDYHALKRAAYAWMRAASRG